MEKIVISNLRLGIIAGGQLGKMLIQEASKWNITTFVLDNDENCPAQSIANYYIKGDPLDYNDVYNFGKNVDITTFEIENVNIDALTKLKEEGYKIIPDPEILQLIKDKSKQKEFYVKHNLPTAYYKVFNNSNEIKREIEKGTIKFPFIQKLKIGGYDGRGVVVINDKNNLTALFEEESIIENKIEILKEVAVIVARNKKGEIKTYPVVEMIFDPNANLVDKLICPARINSVLSEKVTAIANKIIELLDMVGILAVEFFIDMHGNIIVNEIAPRPHNSGHHTIESVITSQFEQHLRAILNLPLGSTTLKLPAVMVNILGSEGYRGPVKYEGLTESMAIEGVKIHLYGKNITQPFRKMGHVTVLSHSLESALTNAEKVKQLIKVKS